MKNKIVMGSSSLSASHTLEKKTGYDKLPEALIAILASYLDPQFIFAVLPLLHKNTKQYTKQLLKETRFWKTLYEPPFDIKKSQQDYLNRRINRQVYLLYAAIKVGATHFLLEECKSWSLEIILSILPISFKKNFILLDLLYYSQLPLTIHYLKKSREKSQNLEQEVKNKLLELKDVGFGYLQLPMDELKKIGYWAKEENRSELKSKAAEFSTILKTLKSNLDKDLIKYRNVFTIEELNYLELFLKIVCWDNEDTQEVKCTSENFQKLLFDTLKSFSLRTYYKCIGVEFKPGENPFCESYWSPKINGVLLGVIIGNLRFLEACAIEIRSFFCLHYQFKNNNDVLSKLPEELFNQATRKEHAAVVQFLSEQEIKAKLGTDKITINHHHAINTAIQNENHNLIMLNIAHGGVIALKKKQYPFIKFISDKLSVEIKFLTVIILAQVNTFVEIDAFFERLIQNSYYDLEEIQENSASRKKFNNRLCYLLEAVRFLLILGADPGKIKEDQEKNTFNNVLKLFREESKSFETALEKHQISSLNWYSKDYLTHLSKVCFLDNLSKENYSTTTPELGSVDISAIPGSATS